MTGGRADLRRWLEESRSRGFLGPGAIEGHIGHSLAAAAAWAEAFPDAGDPERALDLGSGGGVPGLVLCVSAWPSTTWLLLDAQARRCSFLEEAVDALGLGPRVSVRHGRAEDLGREPDHRGSFDVVVARSFAAPAPTAECGAPLLGPAGVLLVSEPPIVAPEGRWPGEEIAELGLTRLRARQDGSSWAVLQRSGPIPDRYPRRAGVPARKPLF